MAVTATFQAKRQERDGTWQYRVGYSGTSAEGGTVSARSAWRRQATEPTQAQIDAEVADVEQAEVDSEIESALLLVERDGADMSTVPLMHNPRARLRRRVLRRALNRMRPGHLDGLARLAALLSVIPLLSQFTNAQIVSVTGWTTARVQAVRAKLQALQDAVDALDHGEGELSDD